VAYYYRLFADNTIGDGTNYGAGTVGFPTMTSSSVSNTLMVQSATATYTISGNTGIGGVTLSYTAGTAKTVISDAVTGNYSITVPSGWTGVVSPSKAGNSFLPVFITYTNVLADATAQNYKIFNKVAPLASTIGQITGPTVSWTDAAATGYEYCVDTSNNNTCNTAWVNATTSLSATAAGLLNGTTYYWQARANGSVEANGGTWWSFTTQSGAFTKTSPTNVAGIPGTSATLTWTPSVGATAYWYCIDMTNNTTCDNPWVRVGASTNAPIKNLIFGKTYYWQVRAEAATFPVFADGGTWYSFTTGKFGKILPATGAFGLTQTQTLSWGTNPDLTITYEYCVDTVNNNLCDTAWVSTGTLGSASPVLTRGTQYYWQVRSVKSATYAYADSNTWWSFATLAGNFIKTAPANAAVGLVTSPTLTWSISLGATLYEYCIDTSNNNTCDTGWVGAGTNNAVTLSGLANNTTYYWLVRSSFAGAYTYSDFSVWRSFTTQSFNKVAPASGSIGLSSAQPLSWTAQTGVTSYQYCVDTVNNSLCDTTWVSAGTSTSVVPTGLLRGRTYYWQVRATVGAVTTEADAGTWWSYSTLAGNFVHRTPPANGATGIATNPTILWSTSQGATLYEYCIDTSNNNTCNTSWVGAGTNTSIALSGLANNTTYYWLVRSSYAGAYTFSDFGVWWSFTTRPFAKSAPLNGAIGQSNNPTLSWSAFTGATSYQYCVDTVNNTTCDTSWVSAGASLNIQPTGLVRGQTYYWQVRSVVGAVTTEADSGIWWTFSTAAGNFIHRTPPANGATGVAINPTLSWSVSQNASLYEYCIDTTNNNTCDGNTWVSAGLLNSIALSGLANNTTYYWLVRSSYAGAYTYSDFSTWWSFTTIP